MSCQSTYTTKNEALVGQNLPAAVLGCSRKNFAAQQLAGAPATCSRNIILDEEKSFFKAVFAGARGVLQRVHLSSGTAPRRRVREQRSRRMLAVTLKPFIGYCGAERQSARQRVTLKIENSKYDIQHATHIYSRQMNNDPRSDLSSFILQLHVQHSKYSKN